MAQLKPLIEKHCAEHGTVFLGVCAQCAAGVWPKRDLEAAQDFLGWPPYNIVPIPYADALRDMMDKLVKAERVIAEANEAAAPFRKDARNACKDLRANYLAVTRAARIFAGAPGADAFLKDPEVLAYLELLVDRTIQW